MKKTLLFFVISFITSGIWAQFNGSGTAESPYLINDTTELAELARLVNNGTSYEGEYFKLMADLDLSGWDSGDGRGWIPIGLETKPFYGTFDGNNHVIHGLKINRPGESSIGFFGRISDAEIKSLGLINVIVNGSDENGGLVGVASGKSKISNCYVLGHITGTSEVGGLVGRAYEADINNCYTSGRITGSSSHVGGLVGIISFSTIKNSYSTSILKGAGSVGGLVGSALFRSDITNCYASGEVRGTENEVGGLVGKIFTDVQVQNSVAANPTISGISYVNRVVGSSDIELYNNFADMTMLVNGSVVNDGDHSGIGKPIADLQSADFFTDSNNWSESWDLQASHADDKSWNLWEGNSFPYFQWQSAPAVFTGDDEVSGIYRTDDGQTTDSLVFYLNGTYQSTLITPHDGKWLYDGSLTKNDTLTVVVYETGRMPSSLDITGVSIDVSNELIISNNNRVWATNGHIFIYVEDSINVQIYSLSGTLVNTLSVTAGETRSIALPTGIYIVKASNQSYKVVLR